MKISSDSARTRVLYKVIISELYIEKDDTSVHNIVSSEYMMVLQVCQ